MDQKSNGSRPTGARSTGTRSTGSGTRSAGSAGSGTRSTATRSTGAKSGMSKKKRKRRNQRLAIVWGVILGIILILAAVIYFTSGGKNSGDKTPTGGVTPGTDKNPTSGVDPQNTPGGELTPTEDPGIDWDTMPLTGLMFTEAMSSNTKYAEDNGAFPDWVELYNNSDKTIKLGAYWISDSKENPQMYQLPNEDLAPGAWYIIYCDGLGEGNHAPFKISSDGEKVYLSTADGFVDRIKVPGDLLKDTSFGRKDDKWMYFDTPTPGKVNGEGYASRTSVPEASKPSGVYDAAFTVTLFGEGTIYYTTDGSKPTTKSNVYKDGIPVNGVMTIRTFAVKDGRESDLGSYTYVVGKSHTLPIIVLSGPYETTIGPKGVDQMNKAGNGIEAEVMMTLIEGGEEKFSIPAGITLHGNNGGSRDIPKKNFNVHFRSAYGAGKLHYKVFDDLEIDEFNSLLLKGGAEDWYRTMIRDEFMTHMVIGNTALCAQACKPCVLYLGGEFWGIYFLRERFSADYVASHFNVSKESVNLMSGYGNVEEGSSKSYNEIVKFVKNNDLNKDENYDWFAEHVDIDSLMDWYICRSYMGDKDFANIRYFNTTEGDGKWRWMFYDLDWGFDPSSATQANPITGIIQNNDRHILIYKLVHSKRGKDAFLKRYAYLMSTILNEEYVAKELDRWRAILTPEIEADRTRWGKTVDGWNNSMDFLYTYNKDGKRDKAVLADIKKYFGLSDSQMTEYFGDKYKK